MAAKVIYAIATILAVLGGNSAVPSAQCPDAPNCLCGGKLSTIIDCNINGKLIRIDTKPITYLNIQCENVNDLDYNELPKIYYEKPVNSVSFKDCPLPSSSFKDVLTKLGVTRTMALTFQNAENLTGKFHQKHFLGLDDLPKLLLTIKRVTKLPDDLFVNLKNLTWLNLQTNMMNISEKIFMPLKRTETLEINDNHVTNATLAKLLSHLPHLKKFSLWQNNVTWFSKDFFSRIALLEELNLSFNGLKELPASIFKPLSNLKKLTLYSNKFATLPGNLFKSNDELQTVIILNNDAKMRSLPKNLFSGLKNLKHAYIQRNGIEYVPYDVFANSPKLTNLSLAHNDIEILPELVFNDQINLLELDLSYNRLSELEPKLFSSLVRLEKLNLDHNKLVSMDGSTFSSLLSLIYLNMEHNEIQTISSYLFENNKQKMSISLAYNKLGLEANGLNWTAQGVSPFLRTYKLGLLNLSHNEFTRTFDEWWINGHDVLDISYNSIHDLWVGDNKNRTIHYAYSKFRPTSQPIWILPPMKQIYVGHNPLSCSCDTYNFVYYLQVFVKAEVFGVDQPDCSELSKMFCYAQTVIVYIHVLLLLIGGISTIVVYFMYRNTVKDLVKEKMDVFYCRQNEYIAFSIDIKYTEKDEEFLFKEVLPVLKTIKHLRITTVPIQRKRFSCPNLFQNDDPYQTVVIFSPNYLTSSFSKVNIKKIRGQMMKASNTVYLFTDNGPENSIFTFLKNERDHECSVLWTDPDFWTKFLAMLPEELDNSDDKEQLALADCPKYTIYPELPPYDDMPPEYPSLFKDSDNFSQV